MRVSLNWLNQLVNIENVNLEHLIEKLTLGGFEVEEVLKVNIDSKEEIIIDISATANRADSLSIKGIAKEINSLIKIPQRTSELLTPYSVKNFSSVDGIEDCSIFFAVTIENLTNCTSPDWLKQRLKSVGTFPLNNLSDYQNYVLLETGFPFEFYDLAKIKEQLKTCKLNLTLGYPAPCTKFMGKNDIDYILNEKTLVLKMNETILGIAGIIPHKNMSCGGEINSLLIEGAIYNSQSIRKTSRILNIRTDRSARYEKGLSNFDFVKSFNRLITLLKIQNPNLICKLVTAYKKVEKTVSPIKLRYKNIVKILGPTKINSTNQRNKIDYLQVSDFLSQLSFKFKFNKSTLVWEIEVPKFRSDDITREIDLIEEIGRLYGFNNFVTSLPKTNKTGLRDISYQIRKKLILCFLSEGLNELIHYSFSKKHQKNSIQLLNPISVEHKNLRTSLLPAIIGTVSENLKQTNSSIEGFEFGHTFLKNKETEYVAGVFGGIPIKTRWSEQSKNLSWFEAKGKIEEIFLKLNLSVIWKISNLTNYEKLVHPHRAVDLLFNDKTYFGIFGQIHPVLARKLNLSLELYLFEFNLDSLIIKLKNNKLSLYERYSFYPKILKDLSFIVNRRFSFEDIKNTIIYKGSPYLVQVNLLDEYQGKSIPPSFTSLCIQLIFQSTERTLTTKEIEDVLQYIKLLLAKKFDAKIRI